MTTRCVQKGRKISKGSSGLFKNLSKHASGEKVLVLLLCRRYNVSILLVTYVLPILVVGACSLHMSLVLWVRPTVGVVTPQIARAKRKKQKVKWSSFKNERAM